MKYPDIMTKYNGIDYSKTNLQINYIDDLWIISAKIPEMNITFNIECSDLKFAFKELLDQTLEKYTWWLQDQNE